MLTRRLNIRWNLPTIAREVGKIPACAAYLRPIAVVFTNPQLRRLQLAWAGSSLGTCAYLIALAVVAFRSGGAAAVGLIMLVRMIAAALAAAPLAALADRYSRRSVMAISDLVRAGLTAAIALLIETAGADRDDLRARPRPSLSSATRVSPGPGGSDAERSPATPEELTASNAVAGTIESTSIFLGPGIGGIVLAVSGTPGVFVVCVAAFLWSAALVWATRRTDARPRQAERRRGGGARRDPGRLPARSSASPAAPRGHRHVRRPGDGRGRPHRLHGRARDRRPPSRKRRRRLSRLRLRRRRHPGRGRRGRPGRRAQARRGIRRGRPRMGRRASPARRHHQHRRRAGAPGRSRHRQHGRRRRGGDAASAFGGRRRPRPRLRRARERAPGGARNRLDARTARRSTCSASGRRSSRPDSSCPSSWSPVSAARSWPSTAPIPRSPSGRPLLRAHPIFRPLAEGTLEQLARALERSTSVPAPR